MCPNSPFRFAPGGGVFCVPSCFFQNYLFGQCESGHDIQHVGGLSGLLRLKEAVEIKAGSADEDVRPRVFQSLQAVQCFSGGGGELHAAVQQNDAPQALPQLGQGGQEIPHQFFAQLIIAAPEGFGGDEDQRLAGREGCGGGFRLGDAASARCGGNAPQVGSFLPYFHGIAVAAEKAAHIFRSRRIVHKHAQRGGFFFFQHPAAADDWFGAGQPAAIQFLGHVTILFCFFMKRPPSAQTAGRRFHAAERLS